MSIQHDSYECFCENQKRHKMVYDGGNAGTYFVVLCEECYKKYDSKDAFLLSEEVCNRNE